MFTAGTVGYPDPLEKPKTWSDNFREFLSQCVQQDPEKRPTAEELLKVYFYLIWKYSY
jgi:serine/threonine protein kinase